MKKHLIFLMCILLSTLCFAGCKVDSINDDILQTSEPIKLIINDETTSSQTTKVEQVISPKNLVISKATLQKTEFPSDFFTENSWALELFSFALESDYLTKTKTFYIATINTETSLSNNELIKETKLIPLNINIKTNDNESVLFYRLNIKNYDDVSKNIAIDNSAIVQLTKTNDSFAIIHEILIDISNKIVGKFVIRIDMQEAN